MLLTLACACSRGPESARPKSIAVVCRTTGIPVESLELPVFDGQVAMFIGRRLRVVNGQLRWGSESYGSVQAGDRAEFTDDGWSINGEHRDPIGIELEVVRNGTTIRVPLSERADNPVEQENFSGELRWRFFDETLHVGERAYGPIRPGDKVQIAEAEVRINGNLASPLR